MIEAYLIHWHAPEWCAESVASLLASSVPVHVTVINNGGELDLPDGVTVIDAGRNLGFAAAANLALDTARGDVVIGCHDVTVAPDAVERLIAALEADPSIGIAGPVINGAGTDADLEWASGTLLAIRAEVAASLRFDQRYDSYVEDVDYCYRARDAGWRVVRVGAAHVTARGSSDPRKALVLMHANTLTFFARRRMLRPFGARLWLLTRNAHRPAYRRALALGLWRLARR